MLDIGNYYIFTPPYSESEYFVKVKNVDKSDRDGKQYVYYTHVLNDMDGDCERQHFENGSINLTKNKISNIISNIENEIKNLEEKKKGFEELHKEMKSDKNFKENGQKERVKKEQKKKEKVENNRGEDQPKRKKAVRRK